MCTMTDDAECHACHSSQVGCCSYSLHRHGSVVTLQLGSEDGQDDGETQFLAAPAAFTRM